jgi:type IV pilus assembly protein PilK
MTLATIRRSPDLASEQLDMLTQQLLTQAGISIDSTSNVIAGCIAQRMEHLGFIDPESYLAAFDESINARAEWLALTDLLTVKETRFFRQPAAYDCLAEYIDSLLTKGPAPKELSFWSAGCSTGQELYSMAMMVENVVAKHQPWLEWHGIGTDISFEAIRTAQHGVFSEAAQQSIPGAQCNRHFQQKLGGRIKVSEDIRSRTHFFHSNLLHVDSAPFADFNVVFCQNVLIYFGREKQRWIIDQLVDRLRVGGLLILGAGEDVSWINKKVRRLQWPGVCAYKKIGD